MSSVPGQVRRLEKPDWLNIDIIGNVLSNRDFYQIFPVRPHWNREEASMPTRSYAADQPYYPGSDLLALGFGTTVAMWTVGYVCRFPGMNTPAWLLLALLMICLTAGGWAAGRFTDRGHIHQRRRKPTHLTHRCRE